MFDEKKINKNENKLDVPIRIDQFRIAGILDELSEKFFPLECKFLNLDSSIWKEQISELMPHFLFVESVWNGYQKTWRGKITSRENFELRELVNWCNQKKIPTVFWNKEDPIHMFTFFGAAFLFDYVFTTDLDCVPLYKRLLGHNRVGLLPFATQIQLFNPIEKYERKEAACFAGSYYAKRGERRMDFESIADAILEDYKLEIYDRNPYPNNRDYSYPNRYKPFIKGSLPVDEIDIAYKSYRVGITLNIVKLSSTMEARRIFELLGCNTLTISNSCLGIKNLFGDLILYYDNPTQFSQKLTSLLNDANQLNRIKLLALRKVLQEHTYKERLEYLVQKIFGINPIDTHPLIAVFSFIHSQNDIQIVLKAFERQSYKKKKLFLFSSEPNIECEHQIVFPLKSFYKILKGQFDYYAFFSTKNYYGENYLLDLALATRYATVSAIGKSSHFLTKDGKTEFCEELGSYRLIDFLKADRCIFSSNLLSIIKSQTQTIDNFGFENIPCLSIDSYNFCENSSDEGCASVEDLKINSGISLKILYNFAEKLTQDKINYSLGKTFTGTDLIKMEIDKSKDLQIDNHPLGYLTFYTLDKKTQIATFKNPIPIHDLTSINEISGNPNLNVYVNSLTEGKVKFLINYYNHYNEFLSRFHVLNRSCTTLPVPFEALFCTITITTKGITYGVVKEIIVGPKVLEPIDLKHLGLTDEFTSN